MRHLLDCEGPHRYAFHWSEDPTPRLLVHRQHQQDALRHSWDGLVAGTDGSVDERTEMMGAGYVLGADPLPIISFFARVGDSVALLPQLGQSRLVYYSCCGMCANGTTIKSAC